MRKIFVNADDFGLTEGVCQGVVAAMRAGVVGGTTAMVCAPGAMERIRRHAPAIPGRIGLHLQLTSGRPCLPPDEIPTLVAEDGRFPAKKTRVGPLDPEQTLAEWRAQYARLREAGIAPSHLDAHHHVHKRPDAFEAYLTLARETGLPARAVTPGQRQALRAAGVPVAGACVLSFYGEELTAERFVALAEAALDDLGPDGLAEVMSHPGLCDARLSEVSSYTLGRRAEYDLFTSPGLAGLLAERGLVPVGPEVFSRSI